jgi:hypothetical protein
VEIATELKDMKHLRHSSLIIHLFVALWLVSAARGASFQNLDFESVILPLVPNDPMYQRVPIANALPFWTAYVGLNQETLILNNNYFLDSTGIGLQAPGGPFIFGPIEGTYTAFLEAGYQLLSHPLIRADSALAQVGDVPADARSFLFKARAVGDFEVTFGGQHIDLVQLAPGPNYTLYGGDVSAFAGMTTELRITAFAGASQLHGINMDALMFSPQSIPEPATMGLLILGAGLLGVRSRKWMSGCE